VREVWDGMDPRGGIVTALYPAAAAASPAARLGGTLLAMGLVAVRRLRAPA